MGLRVYSTLMARKEDFVPRDKGKVAMYVCGPTVYYYIHVGNARCYLNFDTIKRYLKYKGYDVFHVQNFTDVDDKVINQAAEEGITAEEVAEKYTKAFLEDMESLKVDPPDVMPKATETIPEMIEMIKVLIDKKHAYEIDGDVYFDVSTMSDYGKLSHHSIGELEAGARVEVDPRKKDPVDFALWKAAKPGEPKWSSPWGEGRPGWHIECSTMSLKYLGMSFDIHGGGQDLIFPHHENEIAQSESYLGEKPFARYWLHNGFITVEGEKMAKSVGNIVLVRDVLKRYDPEAIRMLVLGTHYRSPLDFSEAKLERSSKSYERLNNLVGNLDRVIEDYKKEKIEGLSLPEGGRKLRQIIDQGYHQFEEAMDDDFNAADALGALFKMTRDVNTFIGGKEELSLEELDLLEEVKEVILKLGGALGLEFVSFAPLSKNSELWELINLRDKLRRERKWKEADEIRTRLAGQNVILEDTKRGTKARIRRKL